MVVAVAAVVVAVITQYARVCFGREYEFLEKRSEQLAEEQLNLWFALVTFKCVSSSHPTSHFGRAGLQQQSDHS